MKQLAVLSSRIADLTRFITQHPTANSTVPAMQERAELVIQREEVRSELQRLPDIDIN